MALAPSYGAPAPVPRHVAIIMDGNGRWAKARGLPRIAGHHQGVEAVRRCVQSCTDLGIGYLTIYAFSSENWKRPAAEVNDLMGLLRVYIRREVSELSRNGVRIRFIGDRGRLAADINRLIEESEEQTKANRRLTLTVAVNYGGRQEILDTVRTIARRVRAGELDPEMIDETMFGRALQTADTPDPDLVIRTSGEQRVSNFLLWQSAYAEFVFTPTLWPDFGHADLESAIREYQSRERRYGGAGG
ncbi:MAG: isoprenyl transferase [Alphaproteobacteria bacterium]|nr:isoprenyl transferase [Alphaproteobacteria bacterium]